jgi:hypothetical protein
MGENMVFHDNMSENARKTLHSGAVNKLMPEKRCIPAPSTKNMPLCSRGLVVRVI